MGEAFNQDVKTALNLYESMIKPILTYAGDFGSYLKPRMKTGKQPLFAEF